MDEPQTSTEKLKKSDYSFVPKETISSFLNLNWDEYQGGVKNIEKDNTILQQRLENLLQLPPDMMQDFMQRVHLKALGQILGLAGHAVEAQPLPQIEVDIIDAESRKREFSVTIPNFNDEKIVQFAAWHQLEYLIYNLYFLIERYLQLAKKAQAVANLPVSVDILMIAIQHEIWIAVNAYYIRKAYSEILDNKAADKNNESLAALIETYIAVIRAVEETEFEFCLPCGSKEHALYLSLVYDKQSDELTIRIDNSSQEETKVQEPIKLSEEKQLKNLVNYLQAVCLAIKSGNSAAREVIYNTARYDFQESKRSGYRPLTKQPAPNCVVEGYWRGMWYRLWQLGESKGDEVFQWMFRQQQQFAVVSHLSQDAYARQRSLRDKIYQTNKPVIQPELKIPITYESQRSFTGVSANAGVSLAEVADITKDSEDLAKIVASLGVGMKEMLLGTNNEVMKYAIDKAETIYAKDNVTNNEFHKKLLEDKIVSSVKNQSSITLINLGIFRPIDFLRKEEQLESKKNSGDSKEQDLTSKESTSDSLSRSNKPQ